MAKVTKVASVPGVATTAAKSAVSSIVTVIVLVFALIYVVIPMLPSVGEQAVDASIDAAKDGANRLGDAVVPLPGRLSGMERNPTTPTTAAPKPYGAPNGPVKPIIPTNQLPPAEPTPDPGRPTLENPIGRGGLLKAIPGVGPALEGTVRALGTNGLKALNP